LLFLVLLFFLVLLLFVVLMLFLSSWLCCCNLCCSFVPTRRLVRYRRPRPAGGRPVSAIAEGEARVGRGNAAGDTDA
jgi:hypothetical protein